MDSDDWSFENTITFVNFRLIAREHHFPRLDDLKGFCYAFITSMLNYGKKSITKNMIRLS